MVVHVSVSAIPATTGETQVGDGSLRSAWAKKQNKTDPIQKVTKAKKGWGCASKGRTPA
jgi:hypothetical protein